MSDIDKQFLLSDMRSTKHKTTFPWEAGWMGGRLENELLKKSTSLNLDFSLAWDVKLMIWIVEWLSSMVFRCLGLGY